jgi:hypothetical protein
MITTKIKITDGITPVLQGMKRQLQDYPKDAEAKFISLTPVGDPNRWKSKKAPPGYIPGNARRNTQLVNKNTIKANYAYAVPLDQGHSTQAPNGMTKPFEAWVRLKVKQIFGK